jgi:hypothetical protein
MRNSITNKVLLYLISPKTRKVNNKLISNRLNNKANNNISNKVKVNRIHDIQAANQAQKINIRITIWCFRIRIEFSSKITNKILI